MTAFLAPRSATGVAAGVPYLVVPPATERPDAPVVVVWHLFDAPRSHRAMAAAVPLAALDAWRIYLGMPLTGDRLPPGGLEAFFALGAQDAVRNIFEPSIVGAARELPGALAQIRRDHRIGDGPMGIMGGSAGAAAAELVLAESDLAVTAAVLVSPLVQLKPLITEAGKHFGAEYPWDEQTEAIAARLDFVARADDIASHLVPAAVLVITGGKDDLLAVLAPADRLVEALRARVEEPERIRALRLPNMAHALADEPGLEPAAQTADAAAVDEAASAWFSSHFALATEPDRLRFDA
ncbi:MAG: hypothetical protein JWN61_1190 [Pseudonocardiales bacterium]|nr:hypothetical protein [Pseudonocardiales bacterium]